MIYSHLANRGFYEGPAGPVVYRQNISIPLIQDQQEYKIEENSPVERNLMVGIWVTEAGAKTSATYTQASGDIFNGLVIELQNQQNVILKKIPATQIKQANDQGRPFYVFLPGPVNLSESTVHAYKNDTIAANTVFEFQVEYVKTGR